MNLASSYSTPTHLSLEVYNEHAGILLDWALEMLGDSPEQSVLAPMIYYNQARRRYLSAGDLNLALAEVTNALDHPLSSERLLKKSRFLRGSIYLALEARDLAYEDFSYLTDTDTAGPYGEMALALTGAWDTVRFSASTFQSPAASNNMDLVVVPLEGGSHWGAAYLTPADTTQLDFTEVSAGVMHCRFDLSAAENCQLNLAFRTASGRDTTLVKPFSSAWVTPDEGGHFSLGGYHLDIPIGSIPTEVLCTLGTPLGPCSDTQGISNGFLSLELGPPGLALNKPATLELALPPPPPQQAYCLVPHAQEVCSGTEMEYDRVRGVAVATINSLEHYDVRVTTLDEPMPTAKVQLVCRPNPVRGSTVIEFKQASNGPATIAIYDLAGRRVKQVASGYHHAGVHLFNWDGCDDSGGRLASGLYFCRFETAAQHGTANILMVR
jgi:hypothetical protein